MFYFQRVARTAGVTTFVGLFLLASSSARAADWITRTVTGVDGVFTDINPKFGFETGLTTTKIAWGQPLAGSFTSFLEFEGYDADPSTNQPWFAAGQTVRPGQRFRAGTIKFRNGTVSTTSSSPNLSVDLQVTAFGTEFQRDNHPLQEIDTWRIAVVQTPNQGIDRVADADYIYFVDFPHLGTFRIFEGRTATVAVTAKFGSVEPDGFEAVDDPNSGVILPLPGAVPVDIRPGGFPNPLNVKSNGVIPIAIVGTSSSDVTTIDPDSVRVEGVGRSKSSPTVEDVATPFFSTAIGDNDSAPVGPDGMPDLVLHFDAQAVLSQIDDELLDGTTLVLTVSGKLRDGRDFVGWDSVKIVGVRQKQEPQRGR